MGHGGGGRLSSDLIRHLFAPAFGSVPTTDSAVLDPAAFGLTGGRLALTTDSYVVRPRFFPGGNVGDLAVNGTVNDLATSGAIPLALSAAFVLEEGMPLDELAAVAATMRAAADVAEVSIVTGDTKVVDAGHGDGFYVTTAGIGVVPAGVDLGPHKVTDGCSIIVSGDIGRHGIAVMSVREGLTFGADIESDTAAVTPLAQALLAAGIDVRMYRDPTRGGLAATVTEIASAANIGVQLDDRAIPVSDPVRAACGFLGLDPLYVANEGRLVAFVATSDVDQALEIWRSLDLGAGATVVGHTVPEHPGVVTARTPIGGTRVVDLPLTEPLPRIC